VSASLRRSSVRPGRTPSSSAWATGSARSSPARTPTSSSSGAPSWIDSRPSRSRSRSRSSWRAERSSASSQPWSGSRSA